MSVNLYGWPVRILLLGLGLLAMPACNRLAMSTEGTQGALWGVELPKSSFADGAQIPERHLAAHGNISPPLSWRPFFTSIVEYVVIMEDADAKDGPTVNWAIYGIPASTTSLPEGAASDTKFPQGRNAAGAAGYAGPIADPDKTHNYYIEVFGLWQPLNLAPGADRAALLAAMNKKVVAVSALRGVVPAAKKK